MKPKLLLCVVLFYLSQISYSQDNIHQDIRSVFEGKAFPESQIMTPGDSCSILNPERHDGYQHANGYAAFTDSVRLVMVFHPQSYPWRYTKVCVGWTSIGGTASLNYRIIMYDSSSGGEPGNILYYSPLQTATTVPAFPLMNWYSSVLTLPAVTETMKSCYIGIVYDNNPSTNCYLSVDESVATPVWTAYSAANITWPPTWMQIGIFPPTGFKCLAIRTEGNLWSISVCEEFSGSTFPPFLWTVAGPGSNYWMRANVSGFGSGTGSAEYDMWNAPTGTNADLITPLATPNICPYVSFDIAYSPYPATPPYTQDSLLIFASTNNGVTYNLVTMLGPTGMQSAPASNSQFTPAPNQWRRMIISLPIFTNRVRFQAESRHGNDLYLDSICIGFCEAVSNNQNVVPFEYYLSQNYPNPFNPSTTLRFGIPKTGLVKLIVFDIVGREIETLVNEVKDVGTYSVTFNASSLASGVYFYKIVAGEFVETKKMLLIK
jgi:hypothetical protein